MSVETTSKRLRDEQDLFRLLDELRTVNNRIGQYSSVEAFEMSVAVSKIENVCRGLAFDEDGRRLDGSVFGRPEAVSA